MPAIALPARWLLLPLCDGAAAAGSPVMMPAPHDHNCTPACVMHCNCVYWPTQVSGRICRNAMLAFPQPSCFDTGALNHSIVCNEHLDHSLYSYDPLSLHLQAQVAQMPRMPQQMLTRMNSTSQFVSSSSLPQAVSHGQKHIVTGLANDLLEGSYLCYSGQQVEAL